MEAQQEVVANMFNGLIEGVTFGVLPDLRTALFAVGGFVLILVALDVIGRIINGVAPSVQASEWWEGLGEEAGYQEYKKRRNQRQDYRDRYEAERRGKNDAEAGIRYLQEKRKNRP